MKQLFVTSEHAGVWLVPVSLLALEMRSVEGASSFMVCSGRCSARVVPFQPGAHVTRLLHLGWGQCGHGLSSGPRESCDIQVP